MFSKKESSKTATKTAKSTKTGGTSQDCSTPPSICPASIPAKTDPLPSKKEGTKTKITVKLDVGFPNQLYIRGKGANLSWDKGVQFKNIKSDEWVWETEFPFTHCEFKVLINDRVYENGDNHVIKQGASLVYTPRFY